ncbi:MAG: polymer-forming cytoskeletal protein [Rhodocyclales bacterium]|nr:polymer-forming cytoskeletal protein [Rhodocyclales bacterium]
MTNRSPDRIDTLIGAGTRIEGDIECTGVLRVQGTILGNISCRDNTSGTLVVDSAGGVTGTVNAAHVAVRGRLVGPVQSSQSIEIHRGALLAGDISFQEIAIHAGGVVEGLLIPTLAPNGKKFAPERRQAPQGPAAHEFSMPAAHGSRVVERLGGARRIGVAILLAIVAVAVAAMSGHVAMMDRLADALAFRATSSAPGSTDPKPLPAAGGDHRSDPGAVEGAPAPLMPSLPAGAPNIAPQSPPVPSGKGQEEVVTVRGANPSRPAGVFLLIPNEPSVLYRKKRDDPTEGARVAVSAGEKISVSIAPDELIRVAEGSDIVILFQGQKVARTTIESGAWISFVPR